MVEIKNGQRYRRRDGTIVTIIDGFNLTLESDGGAEEVMFFCSNVINSVHADGKFNSDGTEHSFDLMEKLL